MDKVFHLLNSARQMSEQDLKRVSDALLKMLAKPSGTHCATVDKVEKCRKCGDAHIVKFGKDKSGKQRYRCKGCGATFTETSFSTFSGTWYSADVWEDYIYLLLKGTSLEECAFQCGISVRTAFDWRHKILSVLQHDQDNRILGGIIEADEKFFPVSYKGNHKNSKRFTMPRKAFKRGSDNRSNNVPKACVMCAVERNGQSYGEVLGAGQPTTQMIDHAFGKRLIPDSIMLADGALAMKNYFTKREDVELIRLQSTTNGSHHGGKPEIRGIYHIQSANNFHMRLDAFLKRYNGVATKYLNHYVGLFVWIENHKKADKPMELSLRESISREYTHVPARRLTDYPPIPGVA